jgi:hypothetical protein
MTPDQRHQRTKLERELSLLQEFALYLRTLDRRTCVKFWGAGGEAHAALFCCARFFLGPEVSLLWRVLVVNGPLTQGMALYRWD